MQPFFHYIKNPSSLFDSLVLHFGQWLPDSTYIKLRYRFQMGKRLNLKTPLTFQEKLQWLKIHNRDCKYTKMVDKILVKDYVASLIGQEYVVPLIGVWNKPEEIDWESLPDKFVLKTNHSGGNTGVVICRDKKTFDYSSAINKLNSSLNKDIYHSLREWPYKDIKKRVFAERYIEAGSDLPDYKFFCFNGEVKALFVATDRNHPTEDVKFDFFDADFNHLPLKQGHENAKVIPNKPSSFDEMKRIASVLSNGLPHVRVDLYEVNGRPVFGEMTFFHFAGMVPMEPEEWDYKFGEWLELP